MLPNKIHICTCNELLFSLGCLFRENEQFAIWGQIIMTVSESRSTLTVCKSFTVDFLLQPSISSHWRTLPLQVSVCTVPSTRNSSSTLLGDSVLSTVLAYILIDSLLIIRKISFKKQLLILNEEGQCHLETEKEQMTLSQPRIHTVPSYCFRCRAPAF